MKRKRLTQLLPWLLPLRIWQRKMFFYARMRFDGNSYAGTVSPEPYPFEVFTASSPLYNSETGFDMAYQHNKAHNLRLAAQTLIGLVIRPGETFSFWRRVRGADRRVPYRDGLVMVDGKLVTAKGGGLCQLSNLLFWLFLNTPLTVVERHGHRRKDFPTPSGGEPEGADATVREGWLDLKIRNDTETAFQIIIDFSETHITGGIRSDREIPCMYAVSGRDVRYYRENGVIREHVSIYRGEIHKRSGRVLAECLLYRNQCEIGYPLPADANIIEGVTE